MCLFIDEKFLLLFIVCDALHKRNYAAFHFFLIFFNLLFFLFLFESSFSGLALALSASHQRYSSANLNNNHQHHHQHHHHHHRHHSKHQDDNIYTNIALGNCIQNLMNSKCESVGLIDQKEFGIPIPKNNRRNNDNSSQQSSPGSGFFCGSPISPSQIYSTGNVTPSGQLGVFSSRISRAASPQRPTIICPDHQRLGILWIKFLV